MAADDFDADPIPHEVLQLFDDKLRMGYLPTPASGSLSKRMREEVILTFTKI